MSIVPRITGTPLLWNLCRNVIKMKKREVACTELQLLVSMLNLFVKCCCLGSVKAHIRPKYLTSWLGTIRNSTLEEAKGKTFLFKDLLLFFQVKC